MSESATSPDAPDAATRPFRATVDAGPLRTAVDLAAAVLDECHLALDEDGIRLWGMDPATVASVDLALGRATFDDYEATGVRTGVDLSRLGDVVGMADRGQSVRLAFDEETRTLDVEFGGLEYALALVDPETIRRPPDRPTEGFDYAGSVTAAAGDFDRAVRAADMVSDNLALGIDPEADAFFVEAEGDTDDVSLELTADDLVDLSSGEARSLYSLDYLSLVARAMPADLDVDLRLGTEQPVAIEYAFADGAGSVEYLVAPRISRR